MKLYEKVLQMYPSLFSEKAVAEITEMLSDKQDNKYAVAVVMGPYIEGKPDAARRARTNYLVFMDEVTHSTGVFAREVTVGTDGTTAIELPFDRLKWFYVGLTKYHPLYEMLMGSENGVRRRKNLQQVDDRDITDVVNCTQVTRTYSEMQKGAFNEIKNYDKPVQDFWWVSGSTEG